MKYVCLTLLALSCSACSRLFENPIVADGGPTLDPALVGHWEAENDEVSGWNSTIRREGEAGIAICESLDRDRKSETAEMNIITARLEQRSLRQPAAAREQRGRASWELYATSSYPPDRVLVRYADIEFWKRAVRDKIVTGSIERTNYGESVTVTASSEEMRAVVLGYGAVLFKDEVAFELRRQSPD